MLYIIYWLLKCAFSRMHPKLFFCLLFLKNIRCIGTLMHIGRAFAKSMAHIGVFRDAEGKKMCCCIKKKKTAKHQTSGLALSGNSITLSDRKLFYAMTKRLQCKRGGWGVRLCGSPRCLTETVTSTRAAKSAAGELRWAAELFQECCIN